MKQALIDVSSRVDGALLYRTVEIVETVEDAYAYCIQLNQTDTLHIYHVIEILEA